MYKKNPSSQGRDKQDFLNRLAPINIHNDGCVIVFMNGNQFWQDGVHMAWGSPLIDQNQLTGRYLASQGDPNILLGIN